MATEKRKIGIVGLGMVGEQLQKWFRGTGSPVFVYDKYKKIGMLTDLDQADIIFLCLPTPHDSRHPLGVSLAVFERIASSFKKPKVFVIKSTVPPGTTTVLQKKFERHFFFHNPEFLTEATAWHDFSKPVAQIVGYTKKSKTRSRIILNILPRARISKIVPSEGAEIFKYARNSYFATKVIFANHIFDLSKAFGVEYDLIKEIMAADPWIGANHLEVVHKGYRGFGGKCLPKDLKTFIKVMRSQKIDPALFEAVDRTNEKLLAGQSLTDTLKKFWLNNANTQL